MCYFDDIHVKAHHDVYLEWYWSQNNPGPMDKGKKKSAESSSENEESSEEELICLNA
jgi:hypothetical protein